MSDRTHADACDHPYRKLSFGVAVGYEKQFPPDEPPPEGTGILIACDCGEPLAVIIDGSVDFEPEFSARPAPARDAGLREALEEIAEICEHEQGLSVSGAVIDDIERVVHAALLLQRRRASR